MQRSLQQGTTMIRTASTLGIARLTGARCPVTVAGPYGRKITGLAMQADPRGEGFHLLLVSGTRVLMTLGPYAECDVVAEWRRLGTSSGLPLMVRMINGSILTMIPKIGDVSVGPLQPDYRRQALGARRPRFLACRRTGRLQRVPAETAGDGARLDRTAEGYPE
jgi:hypothetical protein